MKFLFMPLMLISLIASAQIPISNARKMNAGKMITINGHVTATFGKLAFIQDATGGIAVYGEVLTQDDSISVTGKLTKFNGMLEVVIDSLKSFGQTHPLKPRVVTRTPDHEGELVKLENVRLEPPGHFFYPQRSGSIFLKRDTIQYWIDENTDIPGYSIPATTSITGVVGRFGDNVQLLPRSHIDIAHTNNHQPTTNNHFKVVNWNIEFFGAPRYGPTNDSLQIANVARVLNITQPHIVALQEVSNDDAFRALLTLLPEYDGRCSNRYSYSFDLSGDFPPQKLCFVYKTSTVNVFGENILFSKLFDEDPSDLFSSGRLPYLLEIDAMGHRLTFVNVHAKSGVDETDWSRRLKDITLLKDSLDSYYSSTKLFVLGDFNDDVDVSIVTGKESPYSELVPDYHCISGPLSYAGWHSTISYDDMIDHQVVSQSMAVYHVSTSVLNVFSLIPLYGKTTSDHLPVMSEFDFNKIISGVDDDPTQLFPNPTSGELWFPDGSDIVVMNSLGEIILKKQGAHPPVSLGEYAPGLYSVLLGNQSFKIIRN